MSGFLFKAMVQAVLIFVSDTWMVIPSMGKALGGFQDQVARRLTGRLPRKKIDRKWTYTSAVPEHGRTVHCCAITARPVGGGEVRKGTRGASGYTVVGTGGH